MLTTKNPQAANNIVKFNYKDRVFRREDQVDQVVWHYSVDGNILAKDSDEAHQQEENMDDKKLRDQKKIDAMNEEVKREFGNDPRKFLNS